MYHWLKIGPFRFEKAIDSWKIEVSEFQLINRDGMDRYNGQTELCK